VVQKSSGYGERSRVKGEDRKISKGSQRPAERRKHLRFPLSFPAVFTWEQPQGGSYQSEGITRDVSAKGAYILCTTCPPNNSTVHIEIQLSQFPDAPTILMTGKMQARRVDLVLAGGEGAGFAVGGKGFASRQFLRALPTIVPSRELPAPIPIELHRPVKESSHARTERGVYLLPVGHL
jgi:hypothetical protein